MTLTPIVRETPPPIILRALSAAVADPARGAGSLTIRYLRPPDVRSAADRRYAEFAVNCAFSATIRS